MVMSDRIALLRSGELEQVASPREIYIAARNRLHRTIHRPHKFAEGRGARRDRHVPECSPGPLPCPTVPRCSLCARSAFASRQATRPHRLTELHGSLPSKAARSSLPRRERALANRVRRWPNIHRAYRHRDPLGDSGHDLEFEFSAADAVPVRPSEETRLMFSRAYRTAITVPPLAWVAVFLLVPYLLMFCYSFWSVSDVAGDRPLVDLRKLSRTPAPSPSTGRRCCARCGSPPASRSSRCCSATRSLTSSRFTPAQEKTCSINSSSFRSGSVTWCARMRGRRFSAPTAC